MAQDGSLQQAMQNALQAITAILYHPDFRLNYSGRQDIHQKEEVVKGHHRAMIDIRLKPLIYQLWRMGYETLGSCEEFSAGMAYIEFLSPEWGGDALVRAGHQLGIECKTKAEPVTVSFTAAGKPFSVMNVNAVHVYFPNDKIDVIADSLKKHLDSNGVPP